MTKTLLLAALVAAVPAAAQDRAGGDLDRGVPSVDASPEVLGAYLRLGEDGKDLAKLVEHLHKRIKGGDSVLGLDQALGAADARFTKQGGADSIQKSLLFNGREAREGLKEAYSMLKDYAEKLGKVKELERAADGRLKGVHSALADAASRIKKADDEVRRYADGMQVSEPASAGGDPQAGQLSALEPQEQELADIKEMLDLCKDALNELDGKLDGIDALKAKVERHGEKAGMLDKGAGAVLSVSLTGKGSQAAGGTSKDIIADSLATMKRAADLGKKVRGVMQGIVERTALSAEKAREADKALTEAKGKSLAALAGAEERHQEFPALRAEWDNNPQEAEARAGKLKSQTQGEGAAAAAAGAAAGAQAAAAKAAGATCACAKNKATKAVGEPAKLESLKKLGELALNTPVQDGSAPVGGASSKRLDTTKMKSLLKSASFDGRRR
ncbi:MAG: hypothetical protein HY928_09135 [Elusimicrobia bacterium]|nr:hypothetical protein [Elusimicrobiota bacterium]